MINFDYVSVCVCHPRHIGPDTGPNTQATAVYPTSATISGILQWLQELRIFTMQT